MGQAGGMSAPAELTPLPEDPDGLDQFYGDPPRGVRANMIFSADAAAAFGGRTRPITDAADQMLLLQLRSYSDVILAGSGTVAAESYGPVRLTDAQRERRSAQGQEPEPRLAVVTARGSLSPDLRIFTGDGPPPLIVTGNQGLAARPDLAELGEVMVAGEEFVEPAEMLGGFRSLGLERVLCEGGPFLLSTLVDADLVDDICVTVAPFLAGSQPTTAQPPSGLASPTRLELRHVLHRNGLLYLRYSREAH